MSSLVALTLILGSHHPEKISHQTIVQQISSPSSSTLSRASNDSSSPPPKNPPGGVDQSEYDKLSKLSPQPRRDVADWVAYAGNLLLCAIGVGGIVVALGSLRVLERQTVAAENAANVALASAKAYQTAERAWMSVRRVDTEDLLNARVAGSSPFHGKAFVFIWENIGRTPALNCSIVTMCQITDGDVPSFRPVPDAEQRTATLPVSLEVRGKGAFFTEENIQSMMARKTRIFLYSRAEYRLVYPADGPSSTEYCMEVSHGGFDTKKNEQRFFFSVIGPQNGAS